MRHNTSLCARTKKTTKQLAFIGSVLLSLVFTLPTPAEAETISGRPQIVDGDTLLIDGIKIRLNGIDAPETDQSCLDANTKIYSCGLISRDKLRMFIGHSSVDCKTEGADRYGRHLATCFLRNENLNDWLVRQGLALAYVQYSLRYKKSEEQARNESKGLWAGAFVAPWDWRRRAPETKLLGKTTIEGIPKLLSLVKVQSPPNADCVIKGNVNRKGDRIYFLPGTSVYAKVKMDKGLGERWFCSEEEAEAAGWRKAKN
jgi:endonuclease YncB( thermonuclease family)